MGALSSLLMLKPWDEALQNAWVSAVLPLAGDPEQTCQVYISRRLLMKSFLYYQIMPGDKRSTRTWA